MPSTAPAEDALLAAQVRSVSRTHDIGGSGFGAYDPVPVPAVAYAVAWLSAHQPPLPFGSSHVKTSTRSWLRSEGLSPLATHIPLGAALIAMLMCGYAIEREGRGAIVKRTPTASALSLVGVAPSVRQATPKSQTVVRQREKRARRSRSNDLATTLRRAPYSVA